MILIHTHFRMKLTIAREGRIRSRKTADRAGLEDEQHLRDAWVCGLKRVATVATVDEEEEEMQREEKERWDLRLVNDGSHGE